MSHFICPVCRTGLLKTEKTYVCENRHSFDIAKQGYVNLLLSSGKGKTHGDDREMISSREDFLNRGFYDELSREVSRLAEKYCPDGGVVLDAGCGECKYTCDARKFLKASGKRADLIGVDISKEALRYAARRTREIELAVASVADIPVADGSVDVMINIFAPFEAAEFSRVLKKGGAIIRVYPLEKHLWELKELVYETPYENPVSDMAEAGFEIAEQLSVRYMMEFKSNEDILSLFKMTPYYYRTSENDRRKLDSAESLSCRAEFGITVYKK
ncbi:MAG: methyltransferase domain-containing protein [Oscillospiraceae bacterium]|nr:methyltransferase domain-containing protein [Oscillospiraceae bacterium]